MRLTSRQIVQEWIDQGKNLIGIELALQLPFGSLTNEVEQEGPSAPEMETLLNIVYWIPSLVYFETFLK